jgi:hypothetical protein
MSNKILSYRGLLIDNEQARILLSTKKGEMGYRINKFQAMPGTPGVVNQESVMKVYSIEQSNIDAAVDFSDTTLLGCVYLKQGESPVTPSTLQVIFDQKIINQDIYITHKDASAGEDCNYYLELEVIPLNEMEATVTTLVNIRNNQ